MRFRVLSSMISAGAAIMLALPVLAEDEDQQPIEKLMTKWEKQIQNDLEKDDKLKAMAVKYPLVVLHSRTKYAGGGYKQSAYSFIYETAQQGRHFSDVQLLFHNGGNPKTFNFNMVVGQRNLVIDLGKADFEKNPDPAKISIDHPGTAANSPQVGHVYLERVRDDRGNDFYVLFQVVAVDDDSRYMAFIWRKLPGGKVVKQQGKPIA